jgi:hypothetical protein
MDDPRKLSDDDLHKTLGTLVEEERRCTLRVLSHLREVERRMLYAKCGFPSLFEYCVKRLKYSEGGAQRRISAMRLLKNHPSISEPLHKGEITLSVASMTNTFFRKNPSLSRDTREQFLKNVQGKSYREVETEMRQCMGISEPEIVARMAISRELYDKLEQVKHLLRLPVNLDFNELITKMADQIIARKNREGTIEKDKPSDTSRHVPAAVRSEVWRRDGGQCTFTDPKFKQRCPARHSLQYDHILPFGFGGKNTAENIRLLCPAHNRLSAIEIFGNQTMLDFLPSTK